MTLQRIEKHGGAHAFAQGVERNVGMTKPQQARDLSRIVGHAIAAGPDTRLRREAEAALVERVDGETARGEKRAGCYEASGVVVEPVHGDDRCTRRRDGRPRPQRQPRAVLHDDGVLLEACLLRTRQRRLHSRSHARRERAARECRKAEACENPAPRAGPR